MGFAALRIEPSRLLELSYRLIHFRVLQIRLAQRQTRARKRRRHCNNLAQLLDLLGMTVAWAVPVRFCQIELSLQRSWIERHCFFELWNRALHISEHESCS